MTWTTGVTQQVSNDSTPVTHTYSYDSVGNQLKFADTITGITTMTYSVRNEMLTKQIPNETIITYTYDIAGRRTRVQDYTSGTTTSIFDPRNLQTQITNPQTKTTTILFDPLRRQTSVAAQERRDHQPSYDNAGRLTYLNKNGAGSLVSQLSYAYDITNMRTSQAEADRTPTTWTYDATRQLIRERRNGGDGLDISWGIWRSGGQPADQQRGCTITLSNVGNLNQTTSTVAYQSQDIGNPAVAGSAFWDTSVGGTGLILNSQSTGIDGTSDQFRYLWQSLSGDRTFPVDNLSVTNTDANAKVGVMIRETLAADSKFVLLFVRPDGQTRLSVPPRSVRR